MKCFIALWQTSWAGGGGRGARVPMGPPRCPFVHQGAGVGGLGASCCPVGSPWSPTFPPYEPRLFPHGKPTAIPLEPHCLPAAAPWELSCCPTKIPLLPPQIPHWNPPDPPGDPSAAPQPSVPTPKRRPTALRGLILAGPCFRGPHSPPVPPQSNHTCRTPVPSGAPSPLQRLGAGVSISPPPALPRGRRRLCENLGAFQGPRPLKGGSQAERQRLGAPGGHGGGRARPAGTERGAAAGCRGCKERVCNGAVHAQECAQECAWVCKCMHRSVCMCGQVCVHQMLACTECVCVHRNMCTCTSVRAPDACTGACVHARVCVHECMHQMLAREHVHVCVHAPDACLHSSACT